MTGNTGNNILTGGAGANTFVLKGGFGTDSVTNFKAIGTGHDLLQFDIGAFATPGAALSAAHQVGMDTVIASGANSVTLQGVTASTLTALDFKVHDTASNSGHER